MAAPLQRISIFLALLILISTSCATNVPSCNAIFGTPSAPACSHLVWSQDVIPQDGTSRLFLNYGTPRPGGIPAAVWSRRVFLPVLRENCKVPERTN